MRPSPKRESLLKKLSRPNEDDTSKIRYCNAKPYKITYTNPTFHDLRSFPSAPLNFRIQVTFLYHKGVCIELVLLIHVKIRKFGHFPLENEVNTGATVELRTPKSEARIFRKHSWLEPPLPWHDSSISPSKNLSPDEARLCTSCTFRVMSALSLWSPN